MKRAISAILSLFLIVIFVSALVGCGADIKAENEKLKTENTNLKSDNDKLKLEVQEIEGRTPEDRGKGYDHYRADG